jgi:drug/metabolite transporter, DME family
VLWGTTGTAQALAPAGAQPLAIGALRLIAGGMFLLLFAAARGRPPRWQRRDLPLVLLAAACVAAYQLCFFAAVRLTDVAAGTVIAIGSAPVVAGALGWLFRGEQPGRRWAAATLLAVTGGTLLALSGGQLQANLPGMLLAVGAGGAYATFSLASKGLVERYNTAWVIAAAFSLSALLLAPLLLTQELAWLAQPGGLLVVLHLGLLATALAYLLFGLGLRRIPLAAAVTLSLAEPLTAGALGVLLLGERLSVQAGMGIALIFGGLLLLAVPGAPRQDGAARANTQARIESGRR